MILPDYKIQELIDREVVVGTKPGLINPWSLDVRIGLDLLAESKPWMRSKKWQKHNILEKSYRLKPGEFILTSTREYINLPENIGAELYLKSSRAREGFDHAKAVWIDPGFSGSITLEIRNNLRFHNLEVYAGMRIAQLVFLEGDFPDKSYRKTGRYNDFCGVQPSLDEWGIE